MCVDEQPAIMSVCKSIALC